MFVEARAYKLLTSLACMVVAESLAAMPSRASRIVKVSSMSCMFSWITRAPTLAVRVTKPRPSNLDDGLLLMAHGKHRIVWRVPALIFTALRNMALHYGAGKLLGNIF